ncbi:alpha-mannosidase [Paenibacillus sp. CAA11]|uniref:alpha-mannosidase n=1 Tax=Paenibacillus sp. CAA11 TaxID=1532905 RepID=UPI001F3EC4B3|nr:glycoside hydrolase family 38 C-terminal domain-containing protein [Paenibacillus sp. CAA11]
MKSWKLDIEERIYSPIAELQVEAWVTSEPVLYVNRKAGRRVELKPGERWGELWDCAWFHFQGEIPQEAKGQPVVLLIDMNGEVCLVDREGTPFQGLTNVNSEFERPLGLPGKRVVHITSCSAGGERIDMWGDAGCNDLFGYYRSGTLKEAVIAVCNEEMHQLYYDVEVLLELAEKLPETSSRRAQVLQALYDASLLTSDFTEEEMVKARSLLAEQLSKQNGDVSLTVSAVGHAHLDLAWLWPLRETIRKGARTFSTALRMMERYPDYIFGASQPQLYQWIKDNYPKLYKQIKDRIAEGRWEIQGAMWVEPDSNISGGEALVRQILYGQRFYQEEFGKTVDTLWVPDIFGYSAALPQILLKSGLKYMVTQKLSWNEHNDYPHHTFFWEGIDGSRILTHLPPEDTYNSPAAPRSLLRIEEEYLDKNVSDRALMLFGIGDGGGGPGEEHLERLKREQNLLGLPKVVQETSADFLKKLSEQQHRYQTWRGELYLEKHQGTLTSQARNKRYNRKMEKALRELEFAAVLAKHLCGLDYPGEELEGLWKETLLYQFHDILPGSSIKRVYDESITRYESMLEKAEQLINQCYTVLATAAGGEWAVFNSLPWERKEWIKVSGKWAHIQAPAMGVVRCQLNAAAGNIGASLMAEQNCLQNELLYVQFGDSGSIVSIRDKRENRELLLPGRNGNELILFQDEGGDAWDFRDDYRLRASNVLKPSRSRAYLDGPTAVMEQTYEFGSSALVQQIVLTEDSARLDFITRVDWHEKNKMLRAAFPLDVRCDYSSAEIQFGHIRRPVNRNTSWEAAKDEICAHQWIDLSEAGYGVALLNDCKYGFRASGSELEINLLRSSTYPDPEADQAMHEFVYSLLPHKGDAAAARVYRAGYELNVPLRMIQAEAGLKNTLITPCLGQGFSSFVLDHDQVMIEAVKQAEDDEGVIIRLYEAAGGKANTRLRISLPFRTVEAVNLVEEPVLEPQNVVDDEVLLTFEPFEMKTLKIQF